MTSSPAGGEVRLPSVLRGLREGSVVGGYELVRRLGAGGMGVVWDAVDDGGRHVAIKVLHPQVASDPVSRSRLEREAAVLSRVKDERVARILDIESTPDGDTPAFVVTELVDGPTLQHEIDHEGPYDPAHDAVELADLAHGLIEALAAVHAAGVIHRDLKPSNVMLGANGPVLIDFGIAQSTDDTRLTRTGQVTGTPGFIPPEMLDGGQPSAEVDRYACVGVILFTLTGQAPFGSGPWQTVFRRVYEGAPELGTLPETWPALAAAFTHALHPQVGKRMSVDDLLTVLDEVADGGTGEWAVKEILGPDALGVDEEETDTGSFPVLGYVAPSPQGAGPSQGQASSGGYGSAYGSQYGYASSAVASGSTSPATPAPALGPAAASGYGGYGNSGSTPYGVAGGAASEALPPSIMPAAVQAPAMSGGPGATGGAAAGAAAGIAMAQHSSPLGPTPAPAGYEVSASSGPSAPSAWAAQSSAHSPAWGAGGYQGLSPQQPGQSLGGARVPAWALEPERVPLLTAALGLVLVSGAMMRPIWVVILVCAWVLVSGAVGRADDALRWKRLQQGLVEGDASSMWVRSPWFLLRSLIAGALALLVAALATLPVLLLLSKLVEADVPVSSHTLSAYQVYTRTGLGLAASALVFIAVLWLIPWGKPVRRGSAVMLGRVLPKGVARTVVGGVCLFLTVLALVLLWQGLLPYASLTPYA